MSAAIAIHTLQTPVWLTALVEEVQAALAPMGFVGPLGYRWWEPQSPYSPRRDSWVILIFPTPNEARGGPNDGAKFVSGFRLDLGKVLSLFNPAQEVAWHSPAQYNGDLDGPEVAIFGSFLGRPVWLRIFHLPPPDEPVACVVDVMTGAALSRAAE